MSSIKHVTYKHYNWIVNSNCKPLKILTSKELKEFTFICKLEFSLYNSTKIIPAII